MKSIDIIISTIIGIICGLIYSNPSQSDMMTNLYIFYIVSLSMIVYFALKHHKQIGKKIPETSSAKRYEMFKNTLLVASFIIAIISIVHVYILYKNGGSLIDFISPPLSMLSAYSFISTIVLIKQNRIITSPFLAIPVFWIMFEFIINFQNSSSNPFIADFVLHITVLASISILLLQFAKIFCLKTSFVLFKVSYLMALLFTVSFAIVFLFSTKFDDTFNTLRILINASCVLLFMTPFYFHVSKY